MRSPRRSSESSSIAPRPDELVYARIHLRRPAWQRLQLAVFKQLRPTMIHLDSEVYRLNPGTADGTLVLRLPPRSGIAPEFGGQVDYGSLELERAPSPIRIEFFALPLRSAGVPMRAAQRGRLLMHAIRLGGRTIPIVRDTLQASVDLATQTAGSAVVSGWAGDVTEDKPASRILVFAGERLIAASPPTVPRPDVAEYFREPALTRVGYSIGFPRSELAKGIRVFAISGGRATEAHYPVGWAWGRRPPR